MAEDPVPVPPPSWADLPLGLGQAIFEALLHGTAANDESADALAALALGGAPVSPSVFEPIELRQGREAAAAARLACSSWAAQGATAVRQLQLRRLPDLDALAAKPGIFSQLRHLDATRLPRVKGAVMSAALGGHPELKSLALGAVGGISGPNGRLTPLAACLCACSSLTQLCLTECASLDEAGLSSLSSLRSLESLSICNADAATDTSLAAALAGLPSLTSLELSCCPRLMGQGLGACSSGLLSLSLRWCAFSHDAIASVADTAPQLAELRLEECSGVSDATVAALAAGLCGSLTALSLPGCSEVTDAGAAHLAALSCLTTLQMDWCHRVTDAGLAPLRRLTSLRALSFSGCHEITEVGLASPLAGRGLTSLCLAGCNHLGDEALALMSVMLPHLTALSVARCDAITDTGLCFLAGLTSLRSLSLEWCYKLTDSGLSVLHPLTRLVHFSLVGCIFVTDAGLSVLSGHPRLASLHLDWCEQITDAGLAMLAGNTSLTSLRLDRCYDVTPAGAAAMRHVRHLDAGHLNDASGSLEDLRSAG
eukprot:jgi/Tetstr1/420645/TSEL_011733.t1